MGQAPQSGGNSSSGGQKKPRSSASADSGVGCFRPCGEPAEGAAPAPEKPARSESAEAAQAHRLENADTALMSFSQAGRRERALPDQRSRRSKGDKSVGEDRYLQVKAEWERQVLKEMEEREARLGAHVAEPQVLDAAASREAERQEALEAIRREQQAADGSAQANRKVTLPESPIADVPEAHGTLAVAGSGEEARAVKVAAASDKT
mmetsp:Transcript_16001/g.37732  ORF Transcript_16001/g.37732 Transcript_16001/m.37732 type:complete len:207 (-) Transcript_16001:125-745(-)